MKVKIEFTVDIDPEAWTMNYGVVGEREIREDVKMYCQNSIHELLNDNGNLKEM